MVDVYKLQEKFMTALQEAKNALNIHEDGTFYAQINLAINNLHKQYLRSGTFILSEDEAKERIGFLLAQLESASQSDELLVVDKNFKLDILLTQVPLQFRDEDVYKKINISNVEQPLRFLETLEKTVFKNQLFFSQTAKRGLFCKLLKHGILDVSLISKSKGQCFLITILFSKILINSHHDVRIALHFLKTVNCDLKYLIKKMIPNSIANLEIVSNFDTALFEFIAKEFLNAQIIICSKHLGKSKNNNFDIIFKTNFKNLKTLPIYLYIKISSVDSNIVHICNIASLNTRSRTFCHFCVKYYASSQFNKHRCKHSKCKSCFRYLLKHIAINGIAQCGPSNLIGDLPDNCKQCGIKSPNYICASIHKLSRRKCFVNSESFLKIKKNEKNPFCNSCLGDHVKSDICRLYPYSDKKLPINVNFVVYSKNLNESYIVNMNQQLNNLINLTIINEIEVKHFKFHDIRTDIESIKLLPNYRENKNQITDADRNITIEQTLKQCQLYKTNVTLCNSSFFDTTFSLFYNSRTKVSLKSGIIKQFTVNNITLIHFERFANIKGGGFVELSFLLDPTNVHASLIYPEIPLDNLNTRLAFDKLYFNIEELRYSSDQVYQSVKKSIDKIPAIYSWNHKIPVYTIVRIHQILTCVSMYKFSNTLDNIYNYIRVSLGFSENNVFQHLSKPKIGYDLLLKSLAGEDIPILPARSPKFIQNFSKIEYSICKVLNKIHSTCQNKYSNFINARVLFKIKKISADFACMSCLEFFFIQGTYKSNCNIHQTTDPTQKVQFNKLTKTQNIQLSKSKLSVFKIGLPDNAKIYEFYNCCLKDLSNYCDFITYLKYKNTIDIVDAVNIYSEALSKYNRQHMSGINYNNTIPCALVTPINYLCSSKGAKIYRFDISNAFPSALETIKLPFGKPKIYLGEEAEKYYQTFCKNNGLMFVIKLRVQCAQNTYLQFFEHKNSKVDSIRTVKRHSNCPRCALTNTNEYIKCKHRSRSFIITCLNEDLEFALCNGYTIEAIYELHVFQTKIVSKLNTLCNAFTNLKTNANTRLEKTIIKDIFLSGIGRFALDIGNFENEIFINTPENLFCKLSSLKYFDILEKETGCTASLLKVHHCKIEQYMRARTNPLIFALVSSAVKRLMFQKAMAIHFNKNLTLIRIDTDCLTVKLHENMNVSYLINLLCEKNTIFKFHMEHSNVQTCVSYSKMAYVLINANGDLIFKIPGAILSNTARFATKLTDANQVNEVVGYYLDKLYSHMRILPRIPCDTRALDDTHLINSLPFGYKDNS